MDFLYDVERCLHSLRVHMKMSGESLLFDHPLKIAFQPSKSVCNSTELASKFGDPADLIGLTVEIPEKEPPGLPGVLRFACFRVHCRTLPRSFVFCTGL